MSVLDYTTETCKAETNQHIYEVQRRMMFAANDLIKRAAVHDKSKLEEFELECFTEFTPKLRTSEYMSDEYKENLRLMKPALDHHYANNDHHPEHFPNGINDMNLFNLMEMFCDWDAATMRHNNGDIKKSIEMNAERFNIDPQLTRILMNTADVLRAQLDRR